MNKINEKCFLVKVSKKENVFREVEGLLWKPINRDLYYYKSSPGYGKGEGLFGEKINNVFIKKGRLTKYKENYHLIVNKQFYGESVEDVKKEVNDLVNSDNEKTFTSFLRKWESGRKKEDLITIYDNSTKNYDVEIKELNYIVLENNTLLGFTKTVNEHLKFGWKVLGGMQLSTAGGGESVHSWSEKHYLQSLTNK